MRLLRTTLNWGLCPQTPGIYRFFHARMDVVDHLQGTGATCPPPFRPLSRSLGLLPSIALSRPTQVSPEWTTSTSPCNNFSANGDYPLTSCLTPGVHFRQNHPSLRLYSASRWSAPQSTLNGKPDISIANKTGHLDKLTTWWPIHPGGRSTRLPMDLNARLQGEAPGSVETRRRLGEGDCF